MIIEEIDTTDPLDDVEAPKRFVVMRPHEWSVEDRERLDSIIKMFPVPNEDGILNKTSVRKHNIDTGDAKPFSVKQYRIPTHKVEKVEAALRKKERQGIIKRINFSPWCSPMLAVSKKDSGEERICLDAKRLNTVTIPNKYPPADIAEILRCLEKSKYLTSIDMTSAFYQVELDEESKIKTAFCMNHQLYCYERMVMGLINSMATLASIIDEMFRDLRPYAFDYYHCNTYLRKTLPDPYHYR